MWFTPLGKMGRSLVKKQLWILHTKHCEVHVFSFTLSGEQAHEVEATEGVLFQGYGIGADDEIVNGRFQYENGVVTSYELKTLPTLMKELGHDCNVTRYQVQSCTCAAMCYTHGETFHTLQPRTLSEP